MTKGVEKLSLEPKAKIVFLKKNDNYQNKRKRRNCQPEETLDEEEWQELQHNEYVHMLQD